jgi:hypothetical protein
VVLFGAVVDPPYRHCPSATGDPASPPPRLLVRSPDRGLPSPVVLAAVKDKPSGRPQDGPSLTAAARHGRITLRVGAEEWLRHGPNQRISRKATPTCRQIRWHDPKLSPFHETGSCVDCPHCAREK